MPKVAKGQLKVRKHQLKAKSSKNGSMKLKVAKSQLKQQNSRLKIIRQLEVKIVLNQLKTKCHLKLNVDKSRLLGAKTT